MMIGQAAGEAADLSLKHRKAVQDIPVNELQERLRKVEIALEAPFRPKVEIVFKTSPPFKPGQEIQFEAKIARSRGEVKNFQWNFDGSGEVQGTGANATFRFPVSKNWKMTLCATDEKGYKSLPVTAEIQIGDDPSTDPEVSFTEARATGRWNRAATGLVGYRFRTPYHDMNDGKGGKSVVFETTIPEDGIYRVSLAYPHDANRSPNVPVSIDSAEGTTDIILNQRKKASYFAFAPIGDHRFKRGSKARVTISNEGTTGFVAADAVRWIRVGP